MNVSLAQLWLPILLGAVLAWIASSLIHIVLKYHNSDYKPLSHEDAVSDALGSASPTPGLYSMPYCVDMSQMNDESMQARFKKGPVAFVTVFPNGMPPMGKLIGQQILYFIFGCLLIGYCASLALAPGAPYMEVFRFVAATAFLTFGFALIPFSIWYGHLWSTTAKYLLDALIYALIVAGSFAWLWPGA